MSSLGYPGKAVFRSTFLPPLDVKAIYLKLYVFSRKNRWLI
jgi:hypothetical protein